MKPKSLLSHASYVLAFLLVTLSIVPISDSLAQRRRSPKPGGSFADDFLKTQFWLGIRGGINLTSQTPITRYSGFNPINYEEESLDKTYNEYSDPGFQVGLDITFYHKGFSLCLLPVFNKQVISYETDLRWSGDAEADQYETLYQAKQSFTFVELPLALKYDILQNKVRPFVMGGAFYAFTIAANKQIIIEETDYASGQARTFERANFNLSNKNEFNNNWGVFGGVGVSFDFWNIRSIIDVQYRHSFEPFINESERFSETQFTSFGDVQDDYSLQNMSASVSFVFPLRYIDKQFQSN
jgi:hypothetical protein